MVKFKLLSCYDERWHVLLKRTKHDIYHYPSYVENEAVRMEGRACAAVVEDGDYFFLLPIILRPLLILGKPLPGGDGMFDAISPYGYPCPLLSIPTKTSDAEEFLQSALSMFKNAMCKNSIASVFVRLHPLIRPLSLEQLLKIGKVVSHGKTVWINLTIENEKLWRQTRKTYRNLIRKLEKNGYKARMDYSFNTLSKFSDIYNSTMCSVGASRQYFFGLDYFKKLKKSLGNDINLCVVEDNKGIGAAGLFTECSGIVQYHLSGTASGTQYKDATKLMLHYIRLWAKERGNIALHLGGGVGSKSDSLFFFKSGFSKLFADFNTWRIVTHEEIYEEASMVFKEKVVKEEIYDKNFFPIYRSPITRNL